MFVSVALTERSPRVAWPQYRGECRHDSYTTLTLRRDAIQSCTDRLKNWCAFQCWNRDATFCLPRLRVRTQV
jgi:hypothetical protein